MSTYYNGSRRESESKASKENSKLNTVRTASMISACIEYFYDRFTSSGGGDAMGDPREVVRIFFGTTSYFVTGKPHY